ncbi:MAG: hypothetical protein HOP19_10475 [Acidobacteria bacterium]|nr:hypothetical protein [Acidobacteriota bacterium]
MNSYLAFLPSGIEQYSGNAERDGKQLALGCIERLSRLNDPAQFPPQLLILLTTPAYLDRSRMRKLLNGVSHSFEKADYPAVPLLGCSTAAVFFQRRPYDKGALLICLASRLLEAQVAIGRQATQHPEAAIDELLAELKLHAEGEDLNPFANRTLITFFPGFDQKQYPAPAIHQILRNKLRARVPIFGGVASADDPERIHSGLVFTDEEVHYHALVAASVTSGTPFGFSLSHGLTLTNRLLRVAQFSAEAKLIYSFHEGEGDAATVLKEEQKRSGHSVVLLADVSLGGHPAVDTPKLADDGRALRMTMELDKDTTFKVMRTEAAAIQSAIGEGIKSAAAVARTENPVGCLAFKCRELWRNQTKVGLDFEAEFIAMEAELNARRPAEANAYVGAFFDGEAGVDSDGRSVLRNWSTSLMLLGDELRDRTPTIRGFNHLGELALAPLAEPEETMERLLELLYDIGYPGAMLSFWLPNEQEEMIVAKAAIGARYQQLKLNTCISIGSDAMLAHVARSRMPRFVRDVSELPETDQMAAKQAGLMSQYFIPLQNLDGKVNAILQIDLGDMRHKERLHLPEQQALDKIGAIVSSLLHRCFSGYESRIILALDEAMPECAASDTLHQGLQKYLECALKIFGLTEGHIRLAHPETYSLELIVGVGPHYEQLKRGHRTIDVGDPMPNTRAFREEEIAVVNDAPYNSLHRGLINRLSADAELQQSLQKLGSYLITHFGRTGQDRGLVVFTANQPWLFHWFHRRAIGAFGQRIASLIDHLKQKHSRHFLQMLNPMLSERRAPSEVGESLQSAVRRFASLMNAEVAALYLWDEERELHIVRAQYGWRQPEWVNAAHYRKGDVWMGSIALAGTPRHIPDLNTYFEDQHYDEGGRYSQQIYGQELNKSYQLEAIGLPLRSFERPIGTLMMYRQIRERESVSGFLTTDAKLLMEGGDYLANLVEVLQLHRRQRHEAKELHRLRELQKACAALTDTLRLGEHLCREAHRLYQADRCDFYVTDRQAAQPKLIWRAGFTRNAAGEAEAHTATTVLPQAVLMTAAANQSEQKKPKIWRRALSSTMSLDVKTAATAGAIERICLPLVWEARLIGVLDLQWEATPERADDLRFDTQHLLFAGELIGVTYGRWQARQSLREGLRREAIIHENQTQMMLGEIDEQSENAVTAANAFVLQTAHRMGNGIQELYSGLQLIQLASNEVERRLSLQSCEKQLLELGKLLKTTQAEGLRLLEGSGGFPRTTNISCFLRELVEGAYQRLINARAHNLDLQWQMEIGEEQVKINSQPLVQEAIFNLLNNAVAAMQESPVRRLHVNSHEDGNKVLLVIEDTGKGMTMEQHQAALTGAITTQQDKGLGVLISRLAFNLQGGDLDYRILPTGTVALVTLPLAYKN